MVLVINTYRDTPLENRTDSDDISVKVRQLAERNKICIIRSCDLYNLWESWLEHKEPSSEEIFEQLFNCVGVWQK